MASPLRSDLGAQVAVTMPDRRPRALRRAAAELLVALGDHRAAPHARRWVRTGDPALVGPGLVALAHVGEPIAGAAARPACWSSPTRWGAGRSTTPG